MACGVWRVACGVWRVACGVWRVACGVWRVACGVWRVACGVWRVEGVNIDMISSQFKWSAAKNIRRPKDRLTCQWQCE